MSVATTWVADKPPRVHVEQPTMGALLSRMERDGVISREPHPDDKRATRVALTAKARARVPKARAELAEVADLLVTGFTDRERETFLKLLKRAVENLGDDADDPE